MIRANTATPTSVLKTQTALALLDEGAAIALPLAQKLEDIEIRLKSFVITTDAEAGKLNDLLAGAKLAADKLEADRVLRKEPILSEGRTLDSLYKPSAEAFARIKKLASELLRQHIYRKQEEAARQLIESERLRKIAEQMALAAAQATEDAKTKEEATVAVVQQQEATQAMITANQAVPLNAVPTGIQSGYAKSVLRNYRRVRITNIKLVPRDLLELVVSKNEAPLQALLLARDKAGEPPCEGVEYYEDGRLATSVGLQ